MDAQLWKIDSNKSSVNPTCKKIPYRKLAGEELYRAKREIARERGREANSFLDCTLLFCIRYSFVAGSFMASRSVAERRMEPESFKMGGDCSCYPTNSP